MHDCKRGSHRAHREVCTDTDDGKNYYVKGTAISGSNALSDNCNEDGTLTERFCYEDDILWYDQPAQKWEEALPLGNGRIGVMVFGDPVKEHFQLDDDSMWPSDTGWNEPEGNKQDLEEIRRLLFNGKNTEADKLFVEKFYFLLEV